MPSKKHNPWNPNAPINPNSMAGKLKGKWSKAKSELADVSLKEKQTELVKEWMDKNKDDKRAKPDKLADAWAYAKKKTTAKQKLPNGNTYKME